MATINFYLIQRDKTEEKTIKVKYFDKTSKRGKTSFQHSLKLKANPDKWNPFIDKRTKQEKWVKEDSDEAIKLNDFLRNWKKRMFEIKKLISRKDDYGNTVDTSVEELEEAYRLRLDENRMLKFDESGYKKQRKERLDGKKPFEITLSDLVQDYIDKGGKDGDIVEGTITILEQTKKHIKKYELQKNKFLTLNSLTKDCFNSIKEYLIDKNGADLGNGTAKKYLAKMRDVISEYGDEYPHMHSGFFKGTYPPLINQIFFALYEELSVLKEIDFKKNILDQYVNRFKVAKENGESFWTARELSQIMDVGQDTIRKNIERYDFPGELKKISNYQTYVFDKKKMIEFVIDKEWCQNRESLLRKTESYNRVRDWYCFASEAPLRHSDLKELNHKHIIDSYDKNGKMIKVVRLYPKKTIRHRVLQEFPLSEYCLSIIEKYKDEVKGENRILPVQYNNGKLNESLHQMLECSGLFNDNVLVYRGRGKKLFEDCFPRWSQLSFHTSRHTFGTNMAVRDMNLLKIMRALGHSKLSTTQIYMDIISDDFYSSVLNKFKNQPEAKLISLSAETIKESNKFNRKTQVS